MRSTRITGQTHQGIKVSGMAKDAELEALRQRKLEEMRAQQDQHYAAEAQEKQYDAQIQQIIRQILTTDARERLGRLKVARPELVASVEQQLLGLAQSGRLSGKINDEMLKAILDKVVPKKREIKIERK